MMTLTQPSSNHLRADFTRCLICSNRTSALKPKALDATHLTPPHACARLGSAPPQPQQPHPLNRNGGGVFADLAAAAATSAITDQITDQNAPT